MSAPIVFWRDGYGGGRGGHYVRAQSLNTVITEWIAEGIAVAGIVIDPENGNNIDVIVASPPEEAP